MKIQQFVWRFRCCSRGKKVNFYSIQRKNQSLESFQSSSLTFLLCFTSSKNTFFPSEQKTIANYFIVKIFSSKNSVEWIKTHFSTMRMNCNRYDDSLNDFCRVILNFIFIFYMWQRYSFLMHIVFGIFHVLQCVNKFVQNKISCDIDCCSCSTYSGKSPSTRHTYCFCTWRLRIWCSIWRAFFGLRPNNKRPDVKRSKRWIVRKFFKLNSLASIKTTVLWRYLPHGCT